MLKSKPDRETRPEHFIGAAAASLADKLLGLCAVIKGVLESVWRASNATPSALRNHCPDHRTTTKRDPQGSGAQHKWPGCWSLTGRWLYPRTFVRP